jgi:pre-mRNA-splicing factor SPF27
VRTADCDSLFTWKTYYQARAYCVIYSLFVSCLISKRDLLRRCLSLTIPTILFHVRWIPPSLYSLPILSGLSNCCEKLTDVDAEPSAQNRVDIQKIISAELPANYQTTLHPNLPPPPEERISSLMQKELERKESNLPMDGGIDLSRYEAPDPPSPSGKEPSEVLEDWRNALQKAYTSSSHLSTRHENLSLLDQHGKNAWLIGNSQLEEILRGLEKELAETKESTEALHKQRKMAQEARRGELVGLQDAWKRGVGGIIDVELAAENLRMAILEKRRQQAQSH